MDILIRKQRCINLIIDICSKLGEDECYTTQYIEETFNNFSLDEIEKCFLELKEQYK